MSQGRTLRVGRPVLEGSWAKWEQGRRHMDSLHGLIDELIEPLQGRKVPFEAELESQTGIHETWVFKMPQTPDLADPLFAVTIGDLLSCYRGSLDHLAWSAVKRLGTPLVKLDPRAKRQIGFPLPSRWKGFPDSFRNALPGIAMSSPFGQLVKSYQACGRGPRASTLRALRDLSNRDKHRLLIPTFWFPSDMNFKLIPTGGVIVDTDWLINTRRRVPLESHKPIVRVIFAPTVVLLQRPNLELRADATFEPALGGSWWMVSTLHGIATTIGSLLYEAAPLLN